MNPAPRADRQVRRFERGANLIEFGLILPFLLVATMTVIDLSRAFYLKSMMNSAAREAVRVSACLATDPSASPAYDSVYNRAALVLAHTGMTFATANLQVTRTGTSPFMVDSVRVSTQFNWLYLGLLNLFGATGITNPQTLTATAVMRREE